MRPAELGLKIAFTPLPINGALWPPRGRRAPSRAVVCRRPQGAGVSASQVRRACHLVGSLTPSDPCPVPALSLAPSQLDAVSGCVARPASAYPLWARWNDELDERSENRFLAARDGMDARLIGTSARCRIPARELLDELLTECRPHALALGCARALERVRQLGIANGADRQRAFAAGNGRLDHLVAKLADGFLAPHWRTTTANECGLA